MNARRFWTTLSLSFPTRFCCSYDICQLCKAFSGSDGRWRKPRGSWRHPLFNAIALLHACDKKLHGLGIDTVVNMLSLSSLLVLRLKVPCTRPGPCAHQERGFNGVDKSIQVGEENFLIPLSQAAISAATEYPQRSKALTGWTVATLEGS